MTNSVFLASRNTDKLTIISELIRNLLPASGNLVFSNPISTSCEEQHLEDGTVLNRAQAKAEAHLACCGRSMDLLVGSDDAFRIPQYFGDRIICDSQGVTRSIMEGRFALGTELWLIRSFWLVAPRHQMWCRGCITQIPFILMQVSRSDSFETGIYPLSKLLGRIDGKVPVKVDDDALVRQYYAKHSTDLGSALESWDRLRTPITQRHCS